MNRLEPLIERVLFLCAVVSVATTVGIVVVLAVETLAFLREVPLTAFLFGTEWTPLFATPRFGVLPLVAGTVLVSAIAMVVAAPMGLLCAVYLSEYARPGVRRLGFNLRDTRRTCSQRNLSGGAPPADACGRPGGDFPRRACCRGQRQARRRPESASRRRHRAPL